MITHFRFISLGHVDNKTFGLVRKFTIFLNSIEDRHLEKCIVSKRDSLKAFFQLTNTCSKHLIKSYRTQVTLTACLLGIKHVLE
jgi:hypothetical protein